MMTMRRMMMKATVGMGMQISSTPNTWTRNPPNLKSTNFAIFPFCNPKLACQTQSRLTPEYREQGAFLDFWPFLVQLRGMDPWA